MTSMDTFIKYDKEKPNRITKIYVPIDARLIAQQLGVDGDIVFSRLYYYLQKQHGYKEDGIEVPFFKFELSNGGRTERHVVHFPLLASVLANLDYENRKYWWPPVVAWFSVVVSVIAIVVAAWSH
jgi:hypothetical protein